MIKKIAVVLTTVFLGTLLTCQFLQAQTYAWTDEKGNVCFAEDYSQIPEKYKKSAVPVGPTKERMEELKQKWTEYEKQRKDKEREQGVEEGYRPDRSQTPPGSPDIMEEMVRRFPGISYQWTQDMSLWIKVPGAFANDKYTCKEIAESVARFYRTRKGHMVCVHVYYGNFNQITRACE